MKKVLPAKALLIPDGATKVFEGAIFDVYQWPQTMFDGTQATFEMLRRPDTMQVIAIKDGQLIMVNDEQPGRSSQLHFPGGRADDEDDSWITAAKRELLEETGMTFTNWKLVAVYQPMAKIEQFVAWFVATDFDTEVAQNLDNGEKITVKPMPFAQISDMITSGSHPMMAYALPLFNKLKSLQDILNLPEFEGQEVDR